VGFKNILSQGGAYFIVFPACPAIAMGIRLFPVAMRD
jgi:hypothetical protein